MELLRWVQQNPQTALVAVVAVTSAIVALAKALPLLVQHVLACVTGWRDSPVRVARNILKHDRKYNKDASSEFRRFLLAAHGLSQEQIADLADDDVPDKAVPGPLREYLAASLERWVHMLRGSPGARESPPGTKPPGIP